MAKRTKGSLTLSCRCPKPRMGLLETPPRWHATIYGKVVLYCSSGGSTEQGYDGGVSGERKERRGWLDYMRQFWDSVRITLFVLGSALIVFIAARNSVTWYVAFI